MLFVLNPDLIENDLLICMPMESWTFFSVIIFIDCNAEIESQNILYSGG